MVACGVLLLAMALPRNRLEEEPKGTGRPSVMKNIRNKDSQLQAGSVTASSDFIII